MQKRSQGKKFFAKAMILQMMGRSSLNQKLKKQFFFILILSLIAIFHLSMVPSNVKGQFPVGGPDNEVTATSHDGYYHAQFRLEEGSCRFYITSLEEGEHWFLNLTSVYEGNFSIYLFDERPTDNYLGGEEGYIKPEIRAVSQKYNETPRPLYNSDLNITLNNVQLNYTASTTKLHYVEIILRENGPDTYELDSNQEIEPYFIPFIDGYPIWGIIGVFLLSSVFIWMKNKKKVLHLDFK